MKRATICATADLHGWLPKVPACELLVIAGDICPPKDQRQWLETQFRAWLRTLAVSQVVATWGNNDVAGHRGDVPDLPCTFLVDETITRAGLRIYGAPWSTGVSYEAWGQQEEDEWLEGLAHGVPAGLDILVSHIPPYGVLDQKRGMSHGSRILLSEIERVRPRVTVCGHVHAARGVFTFPWGGRVHNVGARDSQGNPRDDAVVPIAVPG